MRSKDTLVFAAVSVAASLFAFVIAVPRQWSRGLLIVDEFWYGHLTQSVFRGDGYVSNVMYPMQALGVESFPVPEALKQAGYSVLGAALWLVTGEGHRPLVFISVVSLGLFAGFIYLLARRLRWSPTVSVLIAAVVVGNPTVARFGTAVAPEAMFFAAFIATLVLILDERRWAAPAAGALHAVVMVIKGHGLIYIPLFVVFLAWRHRKLTIRPAAVYLVALVAALVVMSVALPDGSVQLVHSGGNYSMAFLTGMEGFPIDQLGYKQVEPVDAWGHLLSHPGGFVEKVLRMISRTKGIMEALGGPAMGGVLLPLLCLALGLFLVDLVAPGKVFAPTEGPAGGEDGGGSRSPDVEIYLLFAAMIGMTFAFFWAIYVISRWFVPILPLMVLLILYVVDRFRPAVAGILRPSAVKWVAAAAVLWFAIYPAFYTMWVSYRDPWAWIGTQLAVRFVDYNQVADNVERLVPEGGIVVSEMAHEITWFTGKPTIMRPRSDQDLRVLAERFNVAAVYEHPLFPRDWRYLDEAFELVDDANGRLWIRRDGRR